MPEPAKFPARSAAVGTNCNVPLRRAADFGALVGAEVKQLVLDDRPADCPAVLIPLQRVLRRRKKVSGVEIAVTNKFEQTRRVISFVPDFVTMFTTAPAPIPYWAERLSVCTLNSCTASGFGNGRFVLR